MAIILRSWKRIIGWLTAISIFIFPLLLIPGKADIFLKYPGVDGESTTPGFEKFIQIDSVSFGSSRQITSPANGGKRIASAPFVSEITLSRNTDSASPKLFFEAVAGVPDNNQAELHFTANASGKLITFQKITLDAPLLSQFSQSSSGERPQESISINFTKIALEYSAFENGKLKGTTTSSYDITNGKASVK